ncbi:uncharacterized protein [Venturia canescens]|nr:uncharacterized protein LOC122416840 isoform X2 [Venturia canescens]
MTNLSLERSIYPPAATLTSTNFSGSNSRDFTPVPPPRRKKKNRGRPLPPKPDEVTKSHGDRGLIRSSKDSRHSAHEPLYSSVKLPKNWPNDREVFEHKVNGTGRVIPSVVVAASKSNREKSSREGERFGEKKHSRPKNSSTVSLPNYSELEPSNEVALGEEDAELKIHKITAAGSLPSLITSGALEDLKKSDNEKREREAVKLDRGEDGKKASFDEVDFLFDVPNNQNTLNSILELNGPKLTSTPIKNGLANDSRSPTFGGGWFLHPDRAPESHNSSGINDSDKHESAKTLFYDCQKDSRSEVFFEAKESLLQQSEDNGEKEKEIEGGVDGGRGRRSLERTLPNESEPLDVCEEKELLREGDSRMAMRSDSEVKLLGRTISEESLPQEMLENEVDFFEDKRPIESAEENQKKEDKKVSVESTRNGDDTKTPPPSPEPKIKPQIFDNDHSTLLKVLRDEAEGSNLSSMTPSLTELEAALSDMLDREEDQPSKGEPSEKVRPEAVAVEKPLESPIEPRIVPLDTEKEKSDSGVPQSLKTILDAPENVPKTEKSTENPSEDPPMVEIDLTNGHKPEPEKTPKTGFPQVGIENLPPYTCPAGEPPEKPSRLHHNNSHEEAQENSGNIPTPPRRRNRYSGYTPSILDRRSLERTATPENPYPNDRLI